MLYSKIVNNQLRKTARKEKKMLDYQGFWHSKTRPV